MPSPFPGMDPYIEGQVWREFHTKLIDEIQVALTPQIQPRYVARIEETVYLVLDPDLLGPPIYPDVAVLDTGFPLRTGAGVGVAEPVLVPLAMPEEVHQAHVEIRVRESMELVTVLEALSPWNKHPGETAHGKYLDKRNAILETRVHLVELDLLRAGRRLPMAKPLPEGDYYAIVSRAGLRPIAEVWARTLRDRLPAFPVPLRSGDSDVTLDLQAVFDTIYDRAGYRYSMDYSRQVEPVLSPEDQAWVQERLSGRG